MDYRTKITSTRHKPSVISERDVIDETESDRGRIVQSAAIRRLQQKTQVYPLESNAAVRSRLTHSLEVQQTGRFIARTILKSLARRQELESIGLEELEVAFTNLVEMSCLIHDVGNPPFGHFGEAAMSGWMAKHGHACFQKACLQPASEHHSLAQDQTPLLYHERLLPDLCCFEGNAQGLRILHTLQGLNLTYSQLAALIKYTRAAWQTTADAGFEYRQLKPGFYFSEEKFVEEIWQHLGMTSAHRHPLVYIMEAADDIAYCIADIEDAVDKGILPLKQLQQLLQDEWDAQCQMHGVNKDHAIRSYLPNIVTKALSDNASEHTFITRLRTRLVRDLVDYAASRYCVHHQRIYDGTLDEPLIDGGSKQHLALLTLKWVARKNVFIQPEVSTPELRGYAALTGLMEIYRPLLELTRDDFQLIIAREPTEHFIAQRLYQRLPGKYKEAYHQAVATAEGTKAELLALEWYYRCRLLIDYFSGMTDNFVLIEYQTLSAI